MADALIGDGQREGDGRAEADSRLGADLPAVGFDQALGYSQSEPRASELGAGHRQEAVEEAREILWGNAAPRVGDGDRYVIFTPGRRDSYFPAARRVADGVAEQVVEHSLDLFRVRDQPRQRGSDIGLERLILGFSFQMKRFDCALNDILYSDRRQTRRDLARFDARQIGQIAHQPLQALAVSAAYVKNVLLLIGHLSGGVRDQAVQPHLQI